MRTFVFALLAYPPPPDFNSEGGAGRGRATQLRLVAMATIISTAMATYYCYG